MKKIIILDRDGVINVDSPNFIKSEEEWLPIPGSLEAIALLNQHGFTVLVTTNQSGIARGLFDLQALNRIHQKMRGDLALVGGKIEGIYFCPHGPDDHCLCRKPLPGMFEQIARDYNLDFYKQRVPAIGDSLRDLEAAILAGCEPILVLTGNGEKTAKQLSQIAAQEQTTVQMAESLLELDRNKPILDIPANISPLAAKRVKIFSSLNAAVLDLIQ